MEIDVATARFAEYARAFCQWAEGEPGPPEIEAHTARFHLARLYSQALELSHNAFWDGNAAEISHEEWKVVFNRFANLPVNYYGKSLDPLEVDGTEMSLGDLADDLADVWRDVKGGLLVFDSGEIEGGVSEWREHFTIHWGLHAASALSILQCWIQANRRFGPQE